MAICIGPSKVQNICVAHGGLSSGGARGIPVGSTEWGRWVCSSVFYGVHGSKCVGQWGSGISRYVCCILAGGGSLTR